MRFDKLDRRFIYLLVMGSIGLSIAFKYSVRPAQMKASEKLYQVIEDIPRTPGKAAMVSMDFGPSTKAENEPQSEVIVEHLFRRRIPVIIMSTYALSEAFLRNIPERVAKRLMKEFPGEKWEYGKDWVNIGYRPGASLFLQALSKSEDIAHYLGKDYMGNTVADMEPFRDLKTLKDIQFLGQFTGLVGALDSYIQFFQRSDYIPPIGHGCTSITIPEAYIYLDSGQLRGALEGIAGAAWYSEILKEKNPKREIDSALVVNTALGIAHLVIIALIIVGNLSMLVTKREAPKSKGAPA